MRFSDLVYLIAAVAHVPLFVGYVHINWNKGHYQFFPLLIAVAGWLIYDRLVDLQKTYRPGTSTNQGRSNDLGHKTLSASSLATTLSLVLGSAVLGFAALVQSSFLVVPSIMLLTASWILGRYGIEGFKSALPAWLLLLLAVPFPWNLDSILVNRMQFMASGLASWILDSLGQVHFRDGLTLVTANKQFFTEEACSGIRSLFSSLAAISAFGVYNRYPFWRHLFNWIQIVFWVLFGNAVRIALVVYVSDHWTETIGSGAYHELLGIAIFCLILVLALSTNRSFDAFQSDDEADEPGFEPVIDGAVTPRKPTAKSALPRPALVLNLIAGTFFVLVFAFGITLAYARYAYQMATFDVNELVTLEKADLPNQINGWDVRSFDHKIRPETSLLAPSSFMWTLRKNERKCVISLDGPYQTYHDLSVCYRGLGWQLTTAYDVPIENGVNASHSMTSLSMKKRSEHGVVFFSAFDRNAKPLLRSDAVSRRSDARKNVLMVLGLYRPEIGNHQGVTMPVSQIQILHSKQSTISDQELRELKQLYSQVVDLLLKSKRFAIGERFTIGDGETIVSRAQDSERQFK